MDTSSLPSQNGTKFDVTGASGVVYKNIGSVTVVDQITYYEITVTITTPSGADFNMDVTLTSRKAKPK